MKSFLLFIAMMYATQASAQMGLALEGEGWATVKQYSVKGRSSHINQKLSFGPFKTVDIKRSWTKGTSSTSGLIEGVPNTDTYNKIITTEHITKKQTLYFSLTDSTNNVVNGHCISELNAEDFNIGNNSNSVLNLLLDISGGGGQSSNLFYVILIDPSTQIRWELLLDNQAVQYSKDYQGYLAKNDSEYYIIKPASRIKNKKGKTGTMPFGSAGYHILGSSGKPVAAVSLLDKGIVYLTDLDAEEKLLMAAALTALLLQEVGE